MNKSRAVQDLHHYQTLLQTLQLLQLKQYQELCYQLYLLAIYTSENQPKDLSLELHYEYDELYNLSKREDKHLGITSTYQYNTLSQIEYANFRKSLFSLCPS